MAATLCAGHLASTALLAIDAWSGRIIAVTPAGEAVLGGHAIGRVQDLVDRGTIAAPDLARLRRAVDRLRLPAVPDGPDEVAHSWVDEVRVHRPEGTVTVRLSVAHHQRRQRDGELLLVTLTEAGREVGDRGAQLPGLDADLWSITDREARIVAIDPRFEVLWRSPERLVGTLTSMLAHPDDLSAVLPAAHALYNGQIATCSYTLRVAADDGHWVPLQVTLRRMHAEGEPMFISQNRIVDTVRQLIPGGLLSARQTEVVQALFDGLRVPAIAQRDGVSVHTVRNQLNAVYRKLDVPGQAELLSRYHRPVRA